MNLKAILAFYLDQMGDQVTDVPPIHYLMAAHSPGERHTMGTNVLNSIISCWSVLKISGPPLNRDELQQEVDTEEQHLLVGEQMCFHHN